MKYKKQISKNYRKAISLLLLLYFITSPILFAFPQKTCSGACPMAMDKNNSEMQMNMTTGSHCGMMMMMQSKKHQNPCDAEFDMSKCNIDKEYASSSNYIITNKYSTNFDLQQISFVNSYLPNNNFSSLVIKKVNAPQKSPPIFLIVDSFLI